MYVQLGIAGNTVININYNINIVYKHTVKYCLIIFANNKS